MYLNIRVLLIILISIIFSGCHEKNYDVFSEAKKLLTNKSKKEKAAKVAIESKKESSVKVNKKEEIEKQKSRIITDLEKDLVKKDLVKKDLPEKDLVKKELLEKKFIGEERFKENYFIDEKIIKVGVMLPLTGKNSSIGNMILNAIEIAIFQNNDHKIQILIKDTGANPEKAKQAYLELVNKQVSLVIGPLFSKTLAAIQSMPNADKVNIFALTNNKNLAKKGIWIFGVDPQAQTKRVLEYSLNNGAKKIAALLPKNAYGLLLFDTISQFSEEHLIEIEKIEFYDFTIENQRIAAKKISKGFEQYQDFLNQLEDNDFSNDDNLLIEKPFDSVFIAATGQNLTVLSSQLQYNNVDPDIVQYLGISSWEDKSILSEPALEGGVFVTTSELYQKQIKDIYKKSFNKEMPKIAMIAYDILALVSSLNFQNNTIDVSKVINTKGYLGLRGLFRLTDNGIVERAFDLKQIKNKNFRIIEKAERAF